MNQRIIAHKLVPVIYEDDHYLFVNKPAGLCSPRRDRPGTACVGDVLAERGDAETLLPLYDVNQWQSGVLGYAKSEAARQHLLTGLETGSAKPTYLAVVQGRLKPGLRSLSGAIRQVGPDRYAVDRKATGGPRPITELEILERNETRALLRCHPGLLNHHQVRAHLASVKLRVVGDPAYHPPPNKTRRGPMLLHLAELRFHHPGLKRAITVRAETPPELTAAVRRDAERGGLNGTLVAQLRAALATRLPFLLDENTNAFRILNGRADGVPGLTAELYDDVLILQVQQGKLDVANTPLPELARWYQQRLGVAAVYVKHFVKDRSHSGSGPEELRDPRPLVGQPAPEQFVVREKGLNFLVRPYDGYSVGLFLNHRENRRRLHELAQGRNVLNLFAYTCGFSVAAAAGGARSTVNVDVSRKSLEWGKENFLANHLSLEPHLFINDDAFNYFKRAERQDRTFDLIVIDPPSFARAKQTHRVFTVERDLEPLLAGAMSLLAPGGVLFVSTNARGATAAWLREQVFSAAGRRSVTVLANPTLPLDFAGDPEHAKTLIVRMQ